MAVEQNREVQRQLYGEPLGDLAGRIRAALALTQAGLAEVLGLSTPMLSQLLSRQRAKIGNSQVLGRLQAFSELAAEATTLDQSDLQAHLVEICQATSTISTLSTGRSTLQALRVDHSHVIAPLGWAGEDERVLFAMCIVDGGSLATLIGDNGPLPHRFVAEVLRQILSALRAVHAAGLVHRDIEPANILLDATGIGRPQCYVNDEPGRHPTLPQGVDQLTHPLLAWNDDAPARTPVRRHQAAERPAACDGPRRTGTHRCWRDDTGRWEPAIRCFRSRGRPCRVPAPGGLDPGGRVRAGAAEWCGATDCDSDGWVAVTARFPWSDAGSMGRVGRPSGSRSRAVSGTAYDEKMRGRNPRRMSLPTRGCP